jgi:peroxiredoxin
LKKKTFLLIGIIIVIIIAAYIYYNSNLNKAEKENIDISLLPPEITERIEAPGFTLKDLNGNDVSLSDFRGKVVFLNFWATWCGPCQMEMPDFNDYSSQLEKGDKAVLLAVNVEEEEATVKDFIKSNGYTLPVLLDETGKVSANYIINSIPATYVIKPDGTIYNRFVGVTETEKLEALLNIILNKQ